MYTTFSSCILRKGGKSWLILIFFCLCHPLPRAHSDSPSIYIRAFNHRPTYRKKEHEFVDSSYNSKSEAETWYILPNTTFYIYLQTIFHFNLDQLFSVGLLYLAENVVFELHTIEYGTLCLMMMKRFLFISKKYIKILL